MNAFFYPLKRGFYFAEIQGGKVTAYNTDQTRGNNAATLSTHSTAPSVLHCTARQHLRFTVAQPLGLRPPASARWEAGCA